MWFKMGKKKSKVKKNKNLEKRPCGYKEQSHLVRVQMSQC